MAYIIFRVSRTYFAPKLYQPQNHIYETKIPIDKKHIIQIMS